MISVCILPLHSLHLQLSAIEFEHLSIFHPFYALSSLVVILLLLLLMMMMMMTMIMVMMTMMMMMMMTMMMMMVCCLLCWINVVVLCSGDHLRTLLRPSRVERISRAQQRLSIHTAAATTPSCTFQRFGLCVVIVIVMMVIRRRRGRKDSMVVMWR